MSVDSYMNIQLTGTEEFIDGKSTASLGQVLIRCVWLSLWGGGQRGGGCGFERGKRVLIRTCVCGIGVIMSFGFRRQRGGRRMLRWRVSCEERILVLTHALFQYACFWDWLGLIEVFGLVTTFKSAEEDMDYPQ